MNMFDMKMFDMKDPDVCLLWAAAAGDEVGCGGVVSVEEWFSLAVVVL